MDKSAGMAARPGAAAQKSVTSDNGMADIIESSLRTIAIEADGLHALRDALQNGLGIALAKAAAQIRTSPGRVIVSGMGKSGHIAQKTAATLASTGTPAFFVHPGEASHGDLGMIQQGDVIIAMSWSGETVELKSLIDYSRRFSVLLVAMTANAASALGRAADIVLELPKVPEACPHGLAPTTSTLMQLALGDALAVALLESKGFSASDFKVFHPGGQLGANLKFVADIMHSGERLPLARIGTSMADALVTMTQKSKGCIGIVDAQGRLAGVITDGDLRRRMSADLLSRKVDDVMTRNPKSAPPDMLVAKAIEIINASSITALFVVADGKPVGIVHIHDLLRIGVA